MQLNKIDPLSDVNFIMQISVEAWQFWVLRSTLVMDNFYFGPLQQEQMFKDAALREGQHVA